MCANFYSLKWNKSGGAKFVTTKPGEKKPTTTCKEYKRNPDGSITYMVPVSNEYILTIQKDDGSLISEDIYGVIKYFARTVRITQNFRTKFEDFMRQQSYSVDNNGFIRGVYDSVEKYFRYQNNNWRTKKRFITSFFVVCILYFIFYIFSLFYNKKR